MADRNLSALPSFFRGILSFVYFYRAGFVLRFYSYHQAVLLAQKRDRETGDGSLLEIQITVSDSTIHIRSSKGTEYDVALENVKYAIETKHTITLFSQARIFYSFRKDAFTVGDNESFLAFLSEKGLKVKK